MKHRNEIRSANGRFLFSFWLAGILLLAGAFSPAISTPVGAAQRKVIEPMAKAGAADEHKMKVLPIFFVASD